ncbi:hypothetical protein C8Q80DRAFT_1091513 [Daedaleopsis nitida]|nr:hypothetical protein C8Q80DRAFT_1091513 [Daedaleopsis nitida]
MAPPHSRPTGKCQALEPDGKTRCSRTPLQKRYHCAIHHEQYRTLTRRYKEAQATVDGLEGIPRLTEKAIADINDVKELQAQYKRMHTLQDAVRVEKAGREVHHKRFFLKGATGVCIACDTAAAADAGHKTRLNFLEKKMQENATILDQLDARHYHLRHADDPQYKVWVEEFQRLPLPHLAAVVPNDEQGQKSVRIERLPGTDFSESSTGVVLPAEETEEDDPIAVEFRNAKRERLRKYQWLIISFEDFAEHALAPAPVNGPLAMREVEVFWRAQLQFFRRIILHDPVLANKAHDKVSFLDLFQSPEFTAEDCDRLFGKVNIMGDALIWWKDSFLDAIDLRPTDRKRRDGASVARTHLSRSTVLTGWSVDNRVRLLGSWVYQRQHSKSLTPEGWITYFALSIMLDGDALVPDRSASIVGARAYLMMAGFMLDELVGRTPLCGADPIPTGLRATKRGHIRWAQLQNRSYLIGAVRDDGADPFVAAFLAELRARPDLFIVVSHSVGNHASREVEKFGGPPDETYYCQRIRLFDAPMSDTAPTGSGEWDIAHTAVNTLFGGGKPIRIGRGSEEARTPRGYMDLLRERPGGKSYMFTHVKFPVRYLVIMDVQPNTGGKALTIHVVWAAFRALGLVQGWEASPMEFDMASAKLMWQRMCKLAVGEWMPAQLRDGLTLAEDDIVGPYLRGQGPVDWEEMYVPNTLIRSRGSAFFLAHRNR